MNKTRLEAFSDGVIAILITIMVLELKIPHGTDWHALQESFPVFLHYALSFIFLGIYWNNHHHMIHAAEKVTGGTMWANLHLLFWLSLVPFATSWMGETGNAPLPHATYGAVLLLSALAYTILLRTILAAEPSDSRLHRAIGGDFKGYFSIALYVTAIAVAFYDTRISSALYVTVALTWLIPDRRIERTH
jgi:uncharacterized membrane protein